ncbi:MAG: hypothetical protein LBQ66_01710 [Planctomycetaceae bacterium]|jgi:hypothetical protein|nr:hypothetical protein [Planctomycetaceae bacterium]
MPISHQNCQGQIYFLHEGRTKTGKPQYFFSLKTEGNLPKKIPDGYHIYERPGGQVFLRKIRESSIKEDELDYVQKKIASIVDSENSDVLSDLCSIVHRKIPPEKMSLLMRRFQDKFQADIRKNEIIIYRVQASNAMPIMKFVLENEDKRLFSAYRWCFKGNIDDWIEIGFYDKLKTLVDKHCPALGTDKFYELLIAVE